MSVGIVGLLGLLLVAPMSAGAHAEWTPGIEVAHVLPGPVFAWSPDGRQLAFAQARDLRVARSGDWSDARRFVSERWDFEAQITQIVWAPGGDRIAVVAARHSDQWNSIWLVDPASGDIEDLLPPEVSRQFDSPGIRSVQVGTWLDASRIAFTQHCGPACKTVHQVAVDSRRYGHYCIAGVDHGFAWDTAGAWAIFGGHLGALGLIDLGRTRGQPWGECDTIFPGYDPRTAQGEWFAFETAAPDGRRVLLRRHANATEPAGLALWDLHSAPTEFAAQGVLAAWAPDGRRIALVRLGQSPPHATEQQPVGDAHLELVALDGTARTLISLGPPRSSNGFEDWGLSRPAWAPDGRTLAVQDASGRLLLLRPESGQPPQQLLTGARARVVWSPDPRWLIVQVATQGVPEIGTPYVVRLP